MKKLLLILLLPIAAYGNNPFNTGRYVAPLVERYYGTNYYVSPTGSNAANGLTLGTAWATHLYAFANVSATDLVTTAAGTYTETAVLNLPAGVSWIGADSTTTIIKSTVTANFSPLLNMNSSVGTNGNQSVSNLKFDGQLTNFLAVFIGGRSNVSIHDCSFRNFDDRGIIFSGKGDYTDGAPSTYATGNTFYNNRVLNCAKYIHFNGSYGMGCLNIGGQDGMLIYNNYINQSQRVLDNGWPIKYANEGHNRGVLIHDNTLIKNVFTRDQNGDGDWDFCIELWYCEGGVDIYSNNIQGGIDMAYSDRYHPYTHSWKFRNNTVSQPTLNTKFQGGIYSERQCNIAEISGNIFNNVAAAVIFNIEDFGAGTYQRINGITIASNQMTNLGRNIGDGNNGNGILFFEGHTTATFDVDSICIRNNTIVAANGNAPFEGIYFNYDVMVGATSNVWIQNNHIQGFNDRWFYLSNSNSTFDKLHINNNNRYLNAASNALYFANGTPTNLDTSNNISQNPLFVSSSDFHLTLGSPNIGAGLNLGYGIDIGKYQYTPIPSTDKTIPIKTKVILLAH